MVLPSLAARGPAGRTVVLFVPRVKAPPAVEVAGAPSAFSTAVSTPSPTHLNSGDVSAGGVASPSALDHYCLEGLLAYARLLFAQPGGGKLLLLEGIGPDLHTITSWDPGDQTLDSIMKGLSLWRPSTQESSLLYLQLAIQEAIKLLFQPLYIREEDGTSWANVNETEALKANSKARLIVMITNSWGADGSAEIYHRMMVVALSKMDIKATSTDCCDAIFLEVSSLEGQSNGSVCIQDVNAGVPLSTSLYKVSPMRAPDLLLDLAYFHLELSAIDIRGLVMPSSNTMENPSSSASTHFTADDKSRMDYSVTGGVGLRLVLCQASPAPFPGDAFYPNGGELRKSRTNVLLRLKTPFSKAQLLALPYLSVMPALLESSLLNPAVKAWDAVRLTEIDAEGYVVLAFGSERGSAAITHLLVWHMERFWLRTLATKDGLLAKKMESHSSREDVVQERESLAFQVAPVVPSSDVTASSGNMIGEKVQNFKKRFFEDGDGAGNQSGLLPGVRERKTYKHVDRPARGHPVNMTHLEVPDGGFDRHSATLAPLLHPVRVVFTTEDPSSDLVNTASNYIARLLELSEKNDGSLFPNVDAPLVRKELYKKMWLDLKRLAKRSRKEKTQGQEDLAQTIRAVQIEFNPSEQPQPPISSHPMPALTDRTGDNVHINKRRRCEEVPRDGLGRPIFPIKLGPSLQVYDLGTIVWNRPTFHSEKYIWPAGYKSRRAYASMLNSENRIFYWCEIVDDGQAPEFRLTPEDDENNPVIGISATAVWTVVVKRVGALRLEEGGKKTFANVSGPEYFGFANPTIARLIQQLPNAELCTKYKRQDYFPNVPMRAADSDAWQGGTANENSTSPSRRDLIDDRENSSQVHSPQEQTDDVEPVSDERFDDLEVVAPQLEVEANLEKPSQNRVHSELRGMPWDSEEFREARVKNGKVGLGEISKQFLASNSGSLFSYYWSSKLKRLSGEPELDGRK